MKITVTIIPTDLVTNLLLSSFCVSSGNEKYFCFLFIAIRALLQSHAEFNGLLYRNFLVCYPVRVIVPCSLLKHKFIIRLLMIGNTQSLRL